VCGCALEQGIVLFLIRRTGIVEDHDGHRVAVAPEMIVVLLDGLPDLSQSIGAASTTGMI